MISWTDVVNVFPDAVNLPVAAQTAILTLVSRQVDATAWGEFVDDGQRWLAAHYASIRDNTAQVTSESLGPMSRSYASGGSSGSGLEGTTFGQEYLRLMRIAIAFPGLVP